MKKLLAIIACGIIFTIIMSVIIVGIGNKYDTEDSESSDLSKYSVKSDDIQFNGKNGEPEIKVYLSDSKKIEEIPLEEYVRGVVAGEMPAVFQIEALKAQAVAARTFALAHLEQYGGERSSKANGADVSDTTDSQVYMNKDERYSKWPAKMRDAYWNKISEAVSKTQGEVLTYQGNLVMAPYYFSTSSGRTENAADIFNLSEPYLKSVISLGEESSQNYKTTVKVSFSQLAQKINTAYPKAGIKASNIKNQISIVSYTDGGSVKQIKIGTITITGVAFRSMLGLNSANFTIKYGSKYVEITCKGYGHDVGMSQFGANAMAKQGKSYIDILTHYYSGIKVDKINNLK